MPLQQLHDLARAHEQAGARRDIGDLALPRDPGPRLAIMLSASSVRRRGRGKSNIPLLPVGQSQSPEGPTAPICKRYTELATLSVGKA